VEEDAVESHGDARHHAQMVMYVFVRIQWQTTMKVTDSYHWSPSEDRERHSGERRLKPSLTEPHCVPPRDERSSLFDRLLFWLVVTGGRRGDNAASDSGLTVEDRSL